MTTQRTATQRLWSAISRSQIAYSALVQDMTSEAAADRLELAENEIGEALDALIAAAKGPQ